MTPETDAKASPIIGFYSCATVPAAFARELERQRDEARKTTAWIPVEQACPEDDATVLIHLADGGVEAGFLDAGAWRFVSGDRVQCPVLHWMPFPEPPED